MCHLPISGVLPPNLDQSLTFRHFKDHNGNIFVTGKKNFIGYDFKKQTIVVLKIKSLASFKYWTHKNAFSHLKYFVSFQFTIQLELVLDEIVRSLCETNIEKPFVPLLLCFHFVGIFGQIWWHDDNPKSKETFVGQISRWLYFPASNTSYIRFVTIQICNAPPASLNLSWGSEKFG